MEKDVLYYLPIEGLENYRITKDGRIWNIDLEKFMSPHITGKKFVISLSVVESKTKVFLIHRLLAQTFIPRPDGTENVVRHLNNDPLDNRLENLAWSSRKETINKSEKITSHSKTILQLEDGKEIARFSSMVEAGKSIKLTASAISKACSGLNQSAGGFQWEYLKNEKIKKVDLSEAEQVRGFSKYYIFPDGKLYGTVRKKYLKPVINSYGYSYYTLCKNNIKKNYFGHRLVAEHFLVEEKEELEGKIQPELGNRLDINHLDKNSLNNNVSNLEWCTRSENMKHAFSFIK